MERFTSQEISEMCYTGDLLYIIRNCGNSEDPYNRSILGVYTTPEKAKEAVEKQIAFVEKSGRKIFPEVKVVIPNTSGYAGCSAYGISYLLDDPRDFELQVRKWSSWNQILEFNPIK